MLPPSTRICVNGLTKTSLTPMQCPSSPIQAVHTKVLHRLNKEDRFALPLALSPLQVSHLFHQFPQKDPVSLLLPRRAWPLQSLHGLLEDLPIFLHLLLPIFLH